MSQSVQIHQLHTPQGMTAVYGEYNQELRRIRTLYESLIFVITAGFATLVSNADRIVGSQSARRIMGIGMLLLALIIDYLVWHVAIRYNKLAAGIYNLEVAFGLRGGALPTPLLVEGVPKYTKEHRGNFIWAFMLMGYTFVLGACAMIILLTSSASAHPDAV